VSLRVVHELQVPLERVDVALHLLAAAVQRAEGPRHRVAHRRHVDVEEDAVRFEPEAFGARRRGNEEHVRADRLHLAAQALRAQLHRFESAAANLADRYGRYGVRKAGPDHGLTRRILAATRREHLPEYDFRNLLRADTGRFQKRRKDLRT
jgi:hypothetical protein